MRTAMTIQPRILLTAVTALALAGATACQAAPADEPPGSGSTATSAAEEPGTDSSEASGEPTQDGPTSPGATLPDFSDVAEPACGEPFALPERVSELRVDGGPQAAMPDHGGGWTTQLVNDGDQAVSAYVAYEDVIVVDAAGAVVASPDPEFMGAEGATWVSIAPGESAAMPLDLSAGCAGGEDLPAGEYQAYGAVTFVADDGSREQAQGGPWPITIGGGDSQPVYTPPSGGVEVLTGCGDAWTPPAPTTGFSLDLIDPIRDSRAASDDVAGRAVLTVTQQMQGLVFTEVVVLRDGEVVDLSLGSDVSTLAVTSPGAVVPLDFSESFRDCASTSQEPTALPPGDYELVVVAAMLGEGEGMTVIAATEPVPVTLT